MAIEIISTLKPKNNGTFPIAEAKDIDVNGKRLDTKLAELEENAGSGGGGTGGGGDAIIDVSALPVDGANDNAFYRVMTASFYYGTIKEELSAMRCEVVDTLPTEGVGCYDPTVPSVVAYFNRADREVYGYVTPMLSAVMGVPVGWYPASPLFSALGKNYGGVISSLDGVLDGTYYVLVEESLYVKIGGEWRQADTSSGDKELPIGFKVVNVNFAEKTGTLEVDDLASHPFKYIFKGYMREGTTTIGVLGFLSFKQYDSNTKEYIYEGDQRILSTDFTTTMYVKSTGDGYSYRVVSIAGGTNRTYSLKFMELVKITVSGDYTVSGDSRLVFSIDAPSSISIPASLTKSDEYYLRTGSDGRVYKSEGSSLYMMLFTGPNDEDIRIQNLEEITVDLKSPYDEANDYGYLVDRLKGTIGIGILTT